MADIRVYMRELSAGGWTDVTSSCVKANFKIRKGFGALGSSSDVSKLSIKYKADDLASATLFHQSIKLIRITKDNVIEFEGYTEGDATVVPTADINSAWVNISASPYSKAFETALAPASERIEGLKVLDPNNATQSLVHALLNRIYRNLEEPFYGLLSGSGAVISTTETIDSIANPLIIEEGESYLDILDQLLDEFGLARYMEGTKVVIVKPYKESDSRGIIKVPYNCVLDNPSLKSRPYKKDKKYKVTVGAVKVFSDEIVYKMNEDGEGSKEDEPIGAGQPYPLEADLEAEYKTSREGENFELIYGEGITYDYIANTVQDPPQQIELAVSKSELGGTSSIFRFQNPTSYGVYLNQLTIYARQAYYLDTSLVVSEENSKIKDEDEVETRFITTTAEAEDYINTHHSESKSERFAVSFSTDKMDLKPNDLVLMGDIPFTILIRYVEKNLATGMTDVSGVAFAIDTRATASKVVKDSSTGGVQYIDLSLSGMAYRYDSDGNLSPANQMITATVKRRGIVDNPVWTIGSTVLNTTATTIEVPASYMTGDVISVSVKVGSFDATSYIYKILDGAQGQPGPAGPAGSAGSQGPAGPAGPAGASSIKPLTIIASQEYYNLSSRGVITSDMARNITFEAQLYGISGTPSWSISRDGGTYTEESLNISVSLAKGDTTKEIKVKCELGGESDEIVLLGQYTGEQTPQRVRGGFIPYTDLYAIKTLEDGVSPILAGDYAYSEAQDKNGQLFHTPVEYKGGSWQPVTGDSENFSLIMGAVIGDALNDNAIPSQSVIYQFVANLVAKNAFIENLDIKSKLQSVNYQESSNGTPTRGWKADADSGIIKSVGMVAEGLKATNAQIVGSLEHPSIKTIEASSNASKSYTATKQYYSVEKMLDSIPHFNNGDWSTYHNAYKSGSIAYNGITYSSYYNKTWAGNNTSDKSTEYTAHVGKNKIVTIMDNVSVSTIASKAGVTIPSSTEPVYLTLYCTGETTFFDCYFNGSAVPIFSNKVNGVTVFKGYVRSGDYFKITGNNTNLFNERDLKVTCTIRQMGRPFVSLGAPVNIGQGSSANWTVPGGWIDTAHVTFTANIFSDYTAKTYAIFKNGVEIYNSVGKNTDSYTPNYSFAVKKGDAIKVEAYYNYDEWEDDEGGISYSESYANLFAVNVAFSNDSATARGLYLVSGDSGVLYQHFPETQQEGWSDVAISSSSFAIYNTATKCGGDGIISTAKTWFTQDKEQTLDPNSSSISINNAAAQKIDRAIVSAYSFQFRYSDSLVWGTISQKSSNGLYDGISISLATMSAITSIETASVIPKAHNTYQIGKSDGYFSTGYITEVKSTTVNATTISATGNITGANVYGAVFN